MGEELKPCPFCGGEAKLMHDRSGTFWWAECTSNDDKPTGRCGMSGPDAATKSAAITAWNTRRSV